MKLKLNLILFTIFIADTFVFAQKPLISGPMLGYIEHREALVWLEVSKATIKVEIRYWKQGDENNSQMWKRI